MYSFSYINIFVFKKTHKKILNGEIKKLNYDKTHKRNFKDERNGKCLNFPIIFMKSC